MALIVLMGPVASGKTTYARELALPTVGIDELRAELGYPPGSSNSDLFAVAYRRLERGLLQWAEVVFDSTAVTSRVRFSLRNVARVAGHPARLVMFDTPLEECKRRNARRDQPVPEEFLERSFAGFTLASVSAPHEGWSEVIRRG